MSREPLPPRRHSEVITFTVQFGARPMKFHATVGFYDVEMTRPGEIFLNGGKIGSEIEAIMRDSAIAVSFALQNGATIEDIKDAFCRDGNGRPEGPLGVLVDILAKRAGAAG